MKVVLFCHSLVSCWNHGNAHFLRGIAREFVALRHEVVVYEPADGWSRANLLRDRGAAAVEQGTELVPGVEIKTYRLLALDLSEALDNADVVLVHEWTDPALVARIGVERIRGGQFLLFFHDTHHRALTRPHEIEGFDLEGYDAVLAFGEVLREVYLARGWGRRVFTWHEAADATLFQANPRSCKDTDLIWIGNWGDGERDQELQHFLIDPVGQLRLRTRVHGVRYPDAVQAHLRTHGLHYGGWLANHLVPDAFAQARVTVHIPRRPYVQALAGIPTIRMFEALACGIPLVSAPWQDTEGLFPPNCYLTARNTDEMVAALSLVLRDQELAIELARAGIEAIRAGHTCRHRVDQFFEIITKLRTGGLPSMSDIRLQSEKMALL
jgi:spore maturation protein CgeB